MDGSSFFIAAAQKKVLLQRFITEEHREITPDQLKLTMIPSFLSS